MKPHSASQTPEKLYKEPKFMSYLVFLCVVVCALFFIDLPWMSNLIEPVQY
jgi:hypothetical protein